jgi:hypothetical protein
MSSSLAEPPRNRLAIAHLMLWMARTAIALAFYRALAFGGDQQLLLPRSSASSHVVAIGSKLLKCHNKRRSSIIYTIGQKRTDFA